MNLDLIDDERVVLEAAEALLVAEYPLSRLRSGSGDDLGPLAGFGLFGLSLPDADTPGPITETQLHARLGRHLLSPSALASAVAVRTAHHSGDRALSGQIAEGAVPVAAGVAQGSELLLLVAPGARLAVWRDGASLRWGAVQPGEAVQAAGGGLPLTRTRRPPEAKAVSAEHWQVLVAAHLLGVAEGARDLAVAYAQLREQFGRPIGSFQAIKHQCADMALRASMLSAQLDFAALALAGGQPDAGFQIAALARLAPGIALRNARTAIQIHGAIGFSAETEAHLFLKQAHRLAQLLLPADLMALPAPLSPYDRRP